MGCVIAYSRSLRTEAQCSRNPYLMEENDGGRRNSDAYWVADEVPVILHSQKRIWLNFNM